MKPFLITVKAYLFLLQTSIIHEHIIIDTSSAMPMTKGWITNDEIVIIRMVEHISCRILSLNQNKENVLSCSEALILHGLRLPINRGFESLYP